MKSIIQNKLNTLIALTLLTCVILTAIGATKNFTQVPFWDMWNGYLDFYVKSRSAGWDTWWAPHNEHRIVLARFFFWADLKFFNGNQLFLISLNYVFALWATITFHTFLNTPYKTNLKPTYVWVATAAIAAWLFSWIQQENFTWGFQSQFFLAQLLPLAALFFLYKSTTADSSISSWLLACIFGLLSVGTMANGVLALPVMALYSIVCRQKIYRSGALVFLSASAAYFYFHGMVKPENHASITQSIINHPTEIIGYTLRYIGGPFYHFFGGTSVALNIAMTLSAVLIAITFLQAIKSLRNTKDNTLQLALVFFIIYIGGTAVGTASGRIIFGVDQALSSRYMTPAVMAWAAFFTLMTFIHFSKQNSNSNSRIFKILSLIIILISLPFQFSATKSHDDELFEKETSSLALALGIKDQEQIGKVFPWAGMALDATRIPVTEHLSIFSSEKLYNISNLIGTKSGPKSPIQCIGNIDSVFLVDEDPNFVKITGWVFDPLHRKVPGSSFLVSATGDIAGYIITGKPRQDVERLIDHKAEFSGFKGYILKSQLGTRVSFQTVNPSCNIDLVVPSILLEAKVKTPTAAANLIDTSNIISSTWSGKDSWKSSILGMVVRGSWETSDADVGSITIKMKKGQAFYYRSGPTGGKQTVQILSEDRTKIALPVAQEWSEVHFIDDTLPESFLVRLSDEGSGWGEWSAIAFNSAKVGNQ